MSLLEQKWHTVDQPWGNGEWVIAGNNDPHAGKFICDCQPMTEDDENDENLAAYVAQHIVDLHNASLMDDKSKRMALTALVASAFTHYKKIIQEDGKDALPPTPSESREAYQNDPMINRCVDGIVLGIGQVLGT